MKYSQYIAMTAGALMFTASMTAFAATNDYTNYWSFDDAAGRNVADSVGGQSGALTGSSTAFGWAGGKAGTALSMDGSAGEAVTLPNGFLKGSQGTLSLWFKLDALSYGNVLFSGKSTIDNNVYFALFVDNDGRPTIQSRDVATANDRKANGTKLLNKNEWYNLVLTADGLGYHMYVNGEEVTIAGTNNGRWFPDITNHTFQYRIGALDATPLSGVLSGIVDEFKIYNRPLTLSDVTALYDEGNAGTPSVPLAIRPAVALTISTDHVLYGGGVTLNWAGTNVTSCVASGGWSGSVAVSGSQAFTLLGGDTTYGISCTGVGGSVSATAHVSVAAKDATTTLAVAPQGSLTVTAVSPAAPVALFTRNLFLGARVDEVKTLQLLLINQGFLDSALATGYFGALTKGAVVKFQVAHHLPATGFFGPMTRAIMNAIK